MTTKTTSKTLVKQLDSWRKKPGNTLKTVASATDRDTNTVRNWISRGNIPMQLRSTVKETITTTNTTEK